MKNLGIFEFKKENNEWEYFDIILDDCTLKACSCSNACTFEHASMELDDYFSLDENLQAFCEDLEAVSNGYDAQNEDFKNYDIGE